MDRCQLVHYGFYGVRRGGFRLCVIAQNDEKGYDHSQWENEQDNYDRDEVVLTIYNKVLFANDKVSYI